MIDPVARGIGPRPFRIGLAVLAIAYYAGLVKQPPQLPGLHAFTFFTEATALFPDASEYVIELRLELWSCDAKAWQLVDPRPFFPIEADSKESRFQRIGYFYGHNRDVMRALDAWIVARSPTIDGSRVGGIRVAKLARPVPAAGTSIARYEFRPLAPIDRTERRDLYFTKSKEREVRCNARD